MEYASNEFPTYVNTQPPILVHPRFSFAFNNIFHCNYNEFLVVIWVTFHELKNHDLGKKKKESCPCGY